MRKLILVLLASATEFLFGCAVGPLVSHETARTVGSGHVELVGGYGQAGYALKWNYGLTDDLDIGVHWESLSIGVRGKYAFINDRDGWSLAGALGAGTSIGGSHYYGDVMGSYLGGNWEPYTTLRVVHVKTDPIDFKNQDTGQVAFTVGQSQYDYGQFMLGTRYWFTPHFLFSVEASSLFAISSGFTIGSNVLVGAALGYRF